MNMNLVVQVLPVLLIFVLLWFLLIRPQKKREQQRKAMQRAIKAGDTITTVGGICGKVVRGKDETLIIEVGSDKVKFEITRWAVLELGVPDSKPIKEEVSEDTSDKPKKPRRLGEKKSDTEVDK